MDDVNEVEDAIRSGALRLGLAVIEATFDGAPIASLDAAEVSVEDALAIAQRMFAPFVTVTTTVFDARADFPEAFSRQGEELDPKGVNEKLRPWEGEPDSVCLQWLTSSGRSLVWLFMPKWRIELNEHVARWKVEQFANANERSAFLNARIVSVADRLESEPMLRRAGYREKKAIADKLVSGFLRGDRDDDVVAHFATTRAVSQVRDNTTTMFGELLEQLDVLATELSATPAFRSARFLQDRKSVAREFLIERSGGYAPTEPVVNALVSATRRA